MAIDIPCLLERDFDHQVQLYEVIFYVAAEDTAIHPFDCLHSHLEIATIIMDRKVEDCCKKPSIRGKSISDRLSDQ